ncbi:MAG: Gfo/Idh/MocA family oxidoreductase, partial [Phycisphaerae bacterium]
MSADSAASVGWGIVGCGRVAARRIAPATVSADNARLVAFCSRSLERASEYMERYGAELAF